MNRMFLACRHCATKAESFLLGDRTVDGYRTSVDRKALQKWLDTHKHCGNEHDHFTIAFDLPKNHDMTSVEAGVAKALRTVQ